MPLPAGRVFLPYAFIEALSQWHGGQSTAEYSVGSCFRANACPDEWSVSDLDYMDDVAGYYVTLPGDMVDSLGRTAQQIVDYADTDEMQWTAQDANEETDDERYYDAAVFLLKILDD